MCLEWIDETALRRPDAKDTSSFLDYEKKSESA